MPRSKLLDAGEEIIYVYPEVRVMDERGNPQYAASTEGYAVRATFSATRQSPSDLIGQVEIGNARGVTRDFRGGSWAIVKRNIRGAWEEWNVVSQPHLSVGSSRAVRHYEFELRSVNGMGGRLDSTPPEVPYIDPAPRGNTPDIGIVNEVGLNG